MTALTAPARPEEDASLRPVPWRRMAWVTWRQHRITLAGVAVFLGALAVCLWKVGLGLHQAYAAAVACHPVSSPGCDNLQSRFSGMDDFLANGYNLLAVPALIGAFTGAPVLARELETGTFRYAWTQGFGRWRWTLAKLVPLAVAVTAAAGAFSVLLSWYYQPYFAARNAALSLPELSSLGDGLFDLRGIVFATWALAAFAIGALAGMLIRRVVPAIAATLAAYTGLAVAAALYLRQHYLTPLVTSNLAFNKTPGSAWILSQWWTKGGTTVSQSTMNHVITPMFYRTFPQVHRSAPKGTAVHVQKGQTLLDVLHYLARHGYTEWTRYQPASRLWPFQWIEGGWLLALSVLLIAATVWLVRRRAA
ncbi:MAG TPA: ABC transporter permease subunit [Streptosporangiaceae bacterium]|nr:ABC transporter permease subunit [Streptosporangiaceae bacterium]